MIITHPYLFNTIVILFIAFTSGWLVYVFVSGRSIILKTRMETLENEKENLRRLAEDLEAQLQKPTNSTPVISFSSAGKINKTNDAGM